jgi:hypothetical protein
MKDYLFVSYNIDAGNIAMSKNFKKMFKDKFDFYDFVPYKKKRKFLNKLISAYFLRKIIKKYNKQGKTIIFNSIGPATLAYGTYNNSSSILVSDWTRTWQNYYKTGYLKQDVIYYIQRYILQKFKRICSRTLEFKKHLIKNYNIDSKKIKIIDAPVIFEEFSHKPNNYLSKKIKVLFIGNDFLRKGGEIILQNQKKISELFDLTLVTKFKFRKKNNFRVIKNVKFKSKRHKNLFKKNDIFFFPSKFDPYGIVISEAASSGMCIITTKDTLSAKYFIKNNHSGIIERNTKYAFKRLIQMSKERKKIIMFKKNIYLQTKKNYSFNIIKKKLSNKLFN